MTSCKAMEDVNLAAAVGAVLSGDFTPEEFRAANRHLAGCEVCRTEYGELAAFRSGFREVYGLAESKTRAASTERPAAIGRRASQRVAWGGLALAASLLVGVAVWQAAPGSDVLTAEPQPSFVTTVGTNVQPEATAPSFAGQVEVDGTVSAVGETEFNLEEITDEELDEILFELGA